MSDINENFDIIEDESSYPEKPKRKGKPPRLSAEAIMILLLIFDFCVFGVWVELSDAYHNDPFQSPLLWLAHLVCTGVFSGALIQTGLMLFSRGGSDD